MRAPWREKGGRFAVTITRRFFVRISLFAVRAFTPRRSNIPSSDSRVKIAVQTVAGAVEADDQTVTDQLVVADAFKIRHIFDADGLGQSGRQPLRRRKPEMPSPKPRACRAAMQWLVKVPFDAHVWRPYPYPTRRRRPPVLQS